MRIVIDPTLQAPINSKIFHLQAKGLSPAPTWVAAEASMVGSARAKALSDLGVEVIGCPRLEGGGLDLAHLLRALSDREVCSVLVEGGAQTLTAFVEAGLVDVWIAHIAPALVGGIEAPSPIGGAGAATMAEVLRPSGPVTRRMLGANTEIGMPLKGDVYGIG